MRNYASFRGNWPVIPDGFESLRSLHFDFKGFSEYKGQSYNRKLQQIQNSPRPFLLVQECQDALNPGEPPV
jgi:hypothetical protein